MELRSVHPDALQYDIYSMSSTFSKTSDIPRWAFAQPRGCAYHEGASITGVNLPELERRA